MKRSSPMRLGRRTPSPSSSSSSAISSSSSSAGATLSQSRSLPASIHPRQQLGDESLGMPTNGGPNPSASSFQQGRAFRRAVSDRVPLSPSGESDLMDVGGGDSVAATFSRIEDNGRRLRYDKISRVEDSQSVRRSFSGDAMAFSSGKGGRPGKVRNVIAASAASVEVPCEQAVDGTVLRQSIPVPVKVEPIEQHVVDNHVRSPPVHKTSRQFKDKAAELFASLPTFAFSGRSSGAVCGGTSPRFRSRQPERGHNEDLLQLFMDVILWRDFSRSTLIFGVGAFSILSSSFMRDMHLNMVTTLSYLALTYLSAVFIRINVLRRLPSSTNWSVSEAAALELTRNALPAINTVLHKLSQLFSGDPGTTLKVAAALWCVARSGYWLSPWNMLRLAFFGAFLIPKCYDSYSAQVQEQGTRLVSQLASVWDNCSHKKVVVAVAGIVTWNFLTMSSRLWIAFFGFVAFKKYQSCGVEVPPVAVKKEH